MQNCITNENLKEIFKSTYLQFHFIYDIFIIFYYYLFIYFQSGELQESDLF